MFQNYFTVALRHLSRGKFYSFINIFGLSVGIACAILIVLFIRDEATYDKFHSKSNSIFRIGVEVWTAPEKLEAGMGQSSLRIGPALKENLPEVHSYVRIRERYEDVQLNDRVTSLPIMHTDSSFFSFFDFPLIYGNPKTALAQPDNIVLTEKAAINLFGAADALGKTVGYGLNGVFKPMLVTGIARNCPDNSSIQFQALIPMAIPQQMLDDPFSWVNATVNTFLFLDPNVDKPALEAKIKRVYEKGASEAIKRILDFGGTEVFVNRLQPLGDVHMSTMFKAEGGGVGKGSSTALSYLLSGMAAFILIIACINFLNLTVARSVHRAKEIGIRKVIGSQGRQLMLQFMGESTLLCVVAFALGICLAAALLPLFNDLVNKHLSIFYIVNAGTISTCLGLLVLTAAIAGFYPALLVSKYDPIDILYHRFKLAGKNYLQHTLITIQFTISALLSVATIVIYLQFNFLTTYDLGFDYHDVVAVGKKNITQQDIRLLRQELMQDPSIEAVSANGGSGMDARIKSDSQMFFFFDAIDASYFPLFRIPLVAGRNFEAGSTADSANAIVVNESFVKKAQWKDPIGEELHMHPFQGVKRKVIGVVKDYHNVGLHQAIGPQAFLCTQRPDYNLRYNAFMIRIRPGTETHSQAAIEKTFRKLFPLNAFSSSFIDDEYTARYQSEEKWKNMMLFAAAITITISGIGLFCLSLLTAEKRRKEISIRKVLGAGVSSIVALLCNAYIKLVVIALVIAMPLSYYLAGMFLNRYPYRIEVGPWIFIGAGSAMVILTLTTVGLQSIKAALANPADALKSE
jgi:putative ABC transport system permease protein